MTEKNIFACNLFLSLNISDFKFFCENCIPLFPSNPPLKVEVLTSPPPSFLKIWLEVQPTTPPPLPPPSTTKKGGCTLCEWSLRYIVNNYQGQELSLIIKYTKITVPVSNAWPDREGSAVKRIKSWLRSTTKMDLLNTFFNDFDEWSNK